MALQHCVTHNNCITRWDAYGNRYTHEECHVHRKSRFGEAAHDVKWGSIVEHFCWAKLRSVCIFSRLTNREAIGSASLQPPSSLFAMLCLTVAKVVCLTVAKVVVCQHNAEYQHLLLADILVDNDREAKRLTGTSMAVARPCVGNTCAAITCRQFQFSQVQFLSQHRKRSASYNDD